MKRCKNCDKATFDHVEQYWYCQETNTILCTGSKWPMPLEAKGNLDELECYLEYKE
jgi:hypothetical protein